MEQFDYIQAAKGSRIMDRSQEDRAEMVRVAVTRAYELRGMPTPSGSDLQFIINETEKKIAAMYPYMTGQELTILTEQGVAGELTRDTKPTASAIFGWMAAYMTSDARKEALRNYQRNLHWNGDQHGPSEDDVAELNRQAEVRALRTLWAEFKTHGRILETEHFRGYVAMAMDGFEKRGIMRLTPENWEAARKVVRENRRRWDLGTLGFRAAAPDVPGSVVKWAMLEMCFRGLVNANYELEITN